MFFILSHIEERVSKKPLFPIDSPMPTKALDIASLKLPAESLILENRSRILSIMEFIRFNDDLRNPLFATLSFIEAAKPDTDSLAELNAVEAFSPIVFKKSTIFCNDFVNMSDSLIELLNPANHSPREPVAPSNDPPKSEITPIIGFNITLYKEEAA